MIDITSDGLQKDGFGASIIGGSIFNVSIFLSKNKVFSKKKKEVITFNQCPNPPFCLKSCSVVYKKSLLLIKYIISDFVLKLTLRKRATVIVLI